jgi:myo-inositol-1-phosphate synthase
MQKVKCAVVGVGNCASSFIQGLSYYKVSSCGIGYINERIGAYGIDDIEVVLGIDVDKRKVGLDVNEAIFSEPNNTLVFHADIPKSGSKVIMGKVLDGVAPHMLEAGKRGFMLSDEAEPSKSQLVEALKASGAQILINFLPVGSQEATEFYMECALEAHLAVVNCMPVFIASNPVWAERFRAKGLPIVGDDIKAQVGATIVHRALSELFSQRGFRVRRTYQLNTGGNTDFMNMLDRSRLISKRESKTGSVQAALAERLSDENIMIGPSDYVPWQNDNKVCFMRIEGEHWGGAQAEIEVRLSVQDSPNSAACVADAVRCAQIALDRGESGQLIVPSACYFKTPPVQMDDTSARIKLAEFINQASPVAAALPEADVRIVKSR